MEKNDRKTRGLMVLGIITFIGLIAGATYAYFQAQGGITSNVPLNVGTNTTDNLSFMVDKDISITANMDNFSNEKGSVDGSAKAIVTLIANNKTNQAIGNYYLYLDITNNEFDYTTEEKTAELILTITDKAGNEVTVNGLTKVTVTDRTGASITGYDLTKMGGLITIVDNKEIKVVEGTTDNKVIDEYNIKITFVNLNNDQSANGGKKFEATIKMQKEEIVLPILAEHITSLYTADGANGLYKHDGVGTYGEYEAGDNSIRYTGADPNNYVCFGSYAKKCPDDNLYRIIGVFDGKVKLIKADFANENLLGISSGEMYIASRYTNYKGSKSTIDRYYWSGLNSNESNTWSASSLNKIALNKNYLDNIGVLWSNKIEESIWKVGGNTQNNIYNLTNSRLTYANEITNPATNAADGKIEDIFKVGLMYVSDYRYAADPTQKDAWSALLGYSSDTSKDYAAVRNYNWLYSGVHEWTITRTSSNTTNSYLINALGNINYIAVFNETGNCAIRPSFYLKPNVGMTGGNGTQEAPFTIN